MGNECPTVKILIEEIKDDEEDDENSLKITLEMKNKAM